MRLCGCRLRRSTALLLAVLGVAAVLYVRYMQQEVELTDPDPDVVRIIRQNKNQKEYINRKGIHVVVGHYKGDPPPENLTQAILNTNDYRPVPGEGEKGMPVVVPAHLLDKMRKLYRINEFNLVASDRISVNRSLPDVRRAGCQDKKYDQSKMSAASIIIVFHNEAWSTLLRTIHSAINRSPRELLKEIILVDDASERSFLGRPLDEYVAQLSVPTRVVRIEERTGLIRSRLMGAQEASGDVIIFLDAHCECTEGWLEPLLARIAESPTSVVCPVIDIINDDSFAYTRSFELHWGGFNWQLHFRWFTLGEREIQARRKDNTAPFRTPAMAGGLFAINRDFFYQSGSYDRDMDIWGGENIEMSLRVWMCGGSVEIHPCSHVGHIFRKNSPYTFPRKGGVGGVLHHNLARVATVWMEKWADFFFKVNPEAAKMKDTTQVSHRMMVKKRMNCNNFKWFLDNIWPEHFFPDDDRFFGKIRNDKLEHCVQRPYATGTGQPSGPATTTDCASNWYTPQLFVMTVDGFIMTDESVCLDVPDGGRETAESRVRIHGCSQLSRQKWFHDSSTSQLVHVDSQKCLDLPTAANPESLVVLACSDGPSQKWTLEEVPWT
ncbi:polypeptide N-acetylgalactosaminyltransferase 1-like isoform X2 [Amphibalanus amphitrite]|uniref:polypeptide N-acetylgalactosaminyltransferase 1-like isoform X1 n=1 Tax=Amphibalanus amphitrite TaxID=1232801 RepID=UPI001C922065|nr:polypeptide N-acetylgalactosaminyltransferase 1-like isoform X1 [Amphibalanus amphitrite]XP_043236678.1 polypeptide N-acetylgalactosaminyltransferase 1-like isoform X2 [Amphibalanus amphitrite]XP_043236679.1 polypeptide N-acetylgalactosaminyltransferase 1-like isoform X2 [Amphibalanus amphitrite]